MLLGRSRLAVGLMWGALVVLALGIAAPSASAVQFEFEDAFGPDGTSLSGFSTAGPVAVDQVEERVYVLDPDANVLYKFDLDGNPIDFGGASPNVSGNALSGLSVGGGLGGRQVAVDSTSHTIYLTGGQVGDNATAIQAFQSNGDPSLFAAGPGEGTNEITGFFGVRGVAVDQSGNIFVAGVNEGEPGRDVNVYKASGALLLASAGGGINGPGNIAVDRKGVLYVLRNAAEVIRYRPSEYPLTSDTVYTLAPGTVDPSFARSVTIDPLTNRLYVLQFSPVVQVAIFSEDGTLEGTFGGAGALSRAYGIAVGQVEESGVDGAIARPYVTHNPEGDLAQAQIFQEEICICPPSIEMTATSSVTGDSAVLRGKVNPNNLDTTYWFEYGLEECQGSCTKVPLLGGAIGDGRKGVLVEQAIAELESETLYHYRVVATNALDTTEGPDKTFMTQGSGLGFALSDSRAWEMVSPAQKQGGTLVNLEKVLIQASVSGNKLVYASRGPLVEGPTGNFLPDPATVLAERDGDGTWASEDLTPRHEEAGRINGATPYKLFSPELLRAELEPVDSTPLSPQASERTPYLWDANGGTPLFTPLVNPANVAPGTKFGPQGEGISNPLTVGGVTPSLDHVVIRSRVVPLVAGAAVNSLYMWSEGELEPLSVLPVSEGGEAVSGTLGSGQGSVRHALSDDGSRAFWAPGEGYDPSGIALPKLFLWDASTGESVRLDVVRSGAGLGPEIPAFNIASADGSVVFFTDSQQLTEDASPSGRDLYRCEIGPVEGKLGCVELTDISAPLAGSGESAQVLDQVPGASEDATRLYFVARGVLDEAPNESGDVAQPGAPNLYYWQEGEGNRFIATLSERDKLVWGQDSTTPGYAERISADASPSGRYFAFTSERSLTGNENRNSSDQPTSEVFAFDSEAAEEQLVCVSCSPSGAAAVGELISGNVKMFPPDPGKYWAGRWVAATLPEASTTEPSGRSLYRPRSVLDNGRVFFNAVDPLVAADSNGNWDVYQYQPVGIGSCALATNTAAIARSGNGCVGLLSSGTSEGDAGFLDASPTGDDVFFLTRGRLSVLDRDDELDAYDARVNGITAVLKPVQECAGEACQPVVGPPNDSTPASESFRGPQTPLRCRKGQRKVHRKGKAVCVRKKQKKSGKQQKKRAGNNRRAER